MAVVPHKINFTSLLVSLIIFLLPFGVLASFSPIPGVRLYVLDIAVGLLFWALLFRLIKTKTHVLNNSVMKGFGLFGGFALVSLLINIPHLNLQEFLVSWFYWIRFVCYGSLLFAPFCLTENQRRSIPFKLFVSGVIFTLIGYIQYALYPNLRNLFYLGWDEHLYRIFSTFLDPNFAAVFMVLTFILGLGLLFEQRENFSLRSKSIFLMIVTIAILPAIFLTYSRSGLIMFGISMIVFLILLKQLKWILLGLLVIGIGIMFVPKNLGGEGVNLLRTASINARFESYQKGISIFESSPIYGVGFNAYRYSQIDRGFLNPKDEDTNHAGAGVSNSWLFVLATTGLIGAGFYRNFWFQVVRRTAQGFNPYIFSKNTLNRDSTPIRSMVLVSSLSGLFIEAFFENSLFYIFVMVWVFLMIGNSLKE